MLSHDLENDPDIVGMVAASAALTLSGVPFMGPIGAARVGYINGEYVLNPTLDQMPDTQMDLVVAATDDAVMMVESEIKELSEEIVLGGVVFAHKGMKPVIDAIIELAEPRRQGALRLPTGILRRPDQEDSGPWSAPSFAPPMSTRARPSVTTASSAAKSKASAALVKTEANPEGYDSSKFSSAFKEAEANILRRDIIEHGKRVDGRPLDKVRQIVSEVGVLPRAHGSALFTRGETQALGGRHPRHRRRRAMDRRPGRHLQGEVPPSLQLPSLLGG